MLGRETDVVLTPVLHDTAGELAQPYDVSDWKRDGIAPVPGRTMPSVTVVERDYPGLLCSIYFDRTVTREDWQRR